MVVPDSDLVFSLSYTGGVAVLAIGPDALVGVDVETTDGANIDPKSVHTVLTPPEVTAVVAAGDRVSAFLRLWVRKQALGKAIGIGPEELVRRDMSGTSPVRQDGFDVTDVALGDGHVAAVAVPTGTRLDLMITAEAAA